MTASADKSKAASELEQKLEDKFQEYRLFAYHRKNYASTKLLAQLQGSLFALNKGEQRRWAERIQAEKPGEDEYHEIVGELKQSVLGLDGHLLSGFTVWIEETITLVLTARIDSGLVVDLLEEFGYLDHGIDFSKIDEMIREVAEGKDSRKVFAGSITTIRRNFGLPLSDRWLNF